MPRGGALKPGETVQVAVFPMNGPISDTPTDRLFMRAGQKIEFSR